jgi:O-antigen biosynthesis protein
MIKKITEKLPLRFKQRIREMGVKLSRRIGRAPRETFQNRPAKNEVLKRQMVVCYDRAPRPDTDSASVRMSAILQLLSQTWHVVFVPIYRTADDRIYEQRLEEIGVEIISTVDFELRFKRESVAAIILSYPLVADLMFDRARRSLPAAKIIFDTVDVQFVRLEREFELTGDARRRREAAELKKIETKLARAADAVWCVTADDKRFLQQFAPDALVEIVPNIHKSANRGLPFAARRDLLFVGSYRHRPNADAVFYFLDEIFPLVLRRLPDARLIVVGSHPTPEILARASENVIVKGFVAEVELLFAESRVFVAPLRYGAGMKGKIGQALAHGLPVVTSGVGAEGMNLQHEREVLIADAPADFAAEIHRVYADENLWERLAGNGFRFVEENLSPRVVGAKIENALRDLLTKKFD